MRHSPLCFLLIAVLSACSANSETGDAATPDAGAQADGGNPVDGGADAGAPAVDAGWQDDFTVELLPGDPPQFKLGYETAAENPFDIGEVEVKAEIRRPSGAVDNVRGFWYQGYNFTQDPQSGLEVAAIKGAPHFRVRYRAVEDGRHLIRFTAAEGGKTLAHGFEAYDLKAWKGVYAGVNAANAQYFGLDDGAPFFPIGFNIGWSGTHGLYDYEHYVHRLAAAGGNWFRMWMIKWSNGLEWSAGKGVGDYKGLGRYALDNASRIDEILDYAESNGVKVQLTFGSYLENTEGGTWNEGSWSENPYNAQNGGPCADAGAFFTDATAQSLYKHRHSYIVAR